MSWRATRTAVLLAGAVTIIIAGSELTLRLAFGFGSPLLYQRDDRVGYLPRPSQNLNLFGVTTRINRFGMRSDDFTDPKPPERIRLLFIGDSVTFGTTYVDQSNLFSEKTKSSLTKALNGPVDVLNMSAGGWAPGNELRFLETRGTFDANAVVLVINTVDLDQPFAGLESSPQFPTHNPPSAIGELWERYLIPRIDARLAAADPGSRSDGDPDPARTGDNLKIFEMMRQVSESHGAAFMIIYSPATYANLRSPAWVGAERAFREWALRMNVLLMDMTPVFARQPHDRVYFDDIHLKPFGHELVSTEIMARAREIGILPPT
jgi:hypothetical protein